MEKKLAISEIRQIVAELNLNSPIKVRTFIKNSFPGKVYPHQNLGGNPPGKQKVELFLERVPQETVVRVLEGIGFSAEKEMAGKWDATDRGTARMRRLSKGDLEVELDWHEDDLDRLWVLIIGPRG